MSVPDWVTSSAGTRVRVALWLYSVVGEGGIFKKAHLRDAFPKVEQIDRRMRDLRPEGWAIATYREDRTLEVDELRLVRIGGPVWERGYSSQQTTAITDKERRATFAADNYMCVHCGISAGESYPDDLLRRAKLAVAKAPNPPGSRPNWRTVCDRCHVAGGPTEESAEAVIADLPHLGAEDLEHLRKWIVEGSRSVAPVDRLWARYQRLTAAEQQLVRHRMAEGCLAGIPSGPSGP